MNETIDIQLDGRDHTVRRLSVQEIHDVGDYLFQEERRRLSEDAEVAGLTPDERLAKIKELRDEWANGVEVLRQSYTRKGAAAFLKKAFEKSDLDASILEEERDLKTLVVASCLACGLPDPFESQPETDVQVDEDEEEIFDDDRG